MSLNLHLGCGSRHLSGFVHIDLDPLPNVDIVHDIGSLPMFDNGTVDLIYCCGAFIYFDREEAAAVLREWHRILRARGTLRLSVPDFEAIVEVYLKSGKDLDTRGILGPLFGKWELHAGKFLYQRTAYDSTSMFKMLGQAGFTNVRRYDFTAVLPADFDDYSKAFIPHMDPTGIQICLNIECDKP